MQSSTAPCTWDALMSSACASSAHVCRRSVNAVFSATTKFCGRSTMQTPSVFQIPEYGMCVRRTMPISTIRSIPRAGAHGCKGASDEKWRERRDSGAKAHEVARKRSKVARKARRAPGVLPGVGISFETPSLVRDAAKGRVSEADLERFVELVFGELLNLHEGNIARYRLRPGEFRAWQDRWKASQHRPRMLTDAGAPKSPAPILFPDLIGIVDIGAGIGGGRGKREASRRRGRGVVSAPAATGR